MFVFARNISMVIFFATSFLYLAGVMQPSAHGDGYGDDGTAVACPACTACPGVNRLCTGGPAETCRNCQCDGAGGCL